MAIKLDTALYVIIIKNHFLSLKNEYYTKSMSQYRMMYHNLNNTTPKFTGIPPHCLLRY